MQHLESWGWILYYPLSIWPVALVSIYWLNKEDWLNWKTAMGKKLTVILWGGLIFYTLLTGYWQFIVPNR